MMTTSATSLLRESTRSRPCMRRTRKSRSARSLKKCPNATGDCCAKCFWKNETKTRFAVTLVWIGNTCGCCYIERNRHSSRCILRTSEPSRRNSLRPEDFETKARNGALLLRGEYADGPRSGGSTKNDRKIPAQRT